MSAPSVLRPSPVSSAYAIIGVSDLSLVSLICLIALLIASYLLSATVHWNRRLSAILNISIAPMTLAFFLVVMYTVVQVAAR